MERGNALYDRISDALSVLATQGVDHADVRSVDTTEDRITTQDGAVEVSYSSRSRGYGIRVYADGGVGFASSQDLSAIKETALRALEAAQATSRVRREPIVYSSETPRTEEYATPIQINPFQVPRSERLNLLLKAESAMLNEEPGLSMTRGDMVLRRIMQEYRALDGSNIKQEIYQVGAGITATSFGRSEMHSRTFPASFRGNYATSGYEFIEEMALIENGPQVAREARLVSVADDCPSGVFDVVIDGPQMALQVHESVGHPIEFDRILGHEISGAGGSFLSADSIGMRYGSNHMNVVADATTPGGLGTYGFDDDGVRAQCVPIIEQGMLVGFITSRETSAVTQAHSTGCCRADGWSRMPIVRMSNINLLPGESTLEDLFGGIDSGLYLCGNRGWSIDDKRLNFQFVCELAYEIKNGSLTGRIYRNPIYTGITPEFWRSCDGVGEQSTWNMYGTPGCGKADPAQSAAVGHGVSPARFRKVKVGVADASP